MPSAKRSPSFLTSTSPSDPLAGPGATTVPTPDAVQARFFDGAHATAHRVQLRIHGDDVDSRDDAVHEVGGQRSAESATCDGEGLHDDVRMRGQRFVATQGEGLHRLSMPRVVTVDEGEDPARVDEEGHQRSWPSTTS